MKQGLLFNIFIFAARLAQGERPGTVALETQAIETKLRFSSTYTAQLYAGRRAQNEFPEKLSWKTHISVVEAKETSQVQNLITAEQEHDLVTRYLNESFEEIRGNRIWSESFNFSVEKQPTIQRNIIISCMKKGLNIVKERQPTLPKDRAIFWGRIDRQIDAYLEIEKALSKSA